MMDAVPDAVTVWAVELGRGTMRERRGTLSLGPEALAFEAADGYSHLRIPLADLRKARRVLGSPVLIVTHAAGARMERVAFYFVQPPPLEPVAPESTDRRGMLSMARQTRRKTRRINAGYLGTWNQAKKRELVEWQEAIRAAIREA